MSEDLEFKAEDEEDYDEEEVKIPEIKGTKNYMTRACYNRLLAERKNLVLVERPETVQVVAWAASNGDRSENGDYLYGKKRLREIDRRIRFLNKRIENSEVIDIANRPPTDQIFSARPCYSPMSRARSLKSASLELMKRTVRSETYPGFLRSLVSF